MAPLRFLTLSPLVLAAALARATAPPAINPCDGPAAAINPNCGGSVSLSPNTTITPLPGGSGAGGGTGDGGDGKGGNLTLSPAKPDLSGNVPIFHIPTKPGTPGTADTGAAPVGNGGLAATPVPGAVATPPAAMGQTAPAVSPFGEKTGDSALAIKAGVELQLGDLAAACEHARAALKDNPKDAKAIKIEGLACRAGLSSGPKDLNGGDLKGPPAKDVMIDPTKGAKLLRGAIGGGTILGPGALQAWLERITQTKAGGDDAQVILLAEQALREFPGNILVLDAQATAMNKVRDFKGALAAANQVLDLDPNHATAWANKAFALRGLGDKKGSIDALRRAAELDPRFEAALKAALAGDAASLFDDVGNQLGKKIPLAAWIGVPAGLGFLLMLAVVLLKRRANAPSDADATTVSAPLGPVTPRALGAGDVVGGNFRIDGELGRGGMGVVYDAFDNKLERRAAIKQLQRDASTTADDLTRFLKEARLVAQLKHPHLAEIYTVIEERGELLLVFEFVDGRTLDKVISTNRGIPPAQVDKILEAITGALDYAHAKKIIHRDLKPSNVMVTRDGATVKVMDFGIAHQATSTGLTRTSASGTPPYMAPEQGMGSVSKSSDLYALGVMTYEMLAGVRPFEGPDFLEPKLRKEFPPVTQRAPALPAGLDAFFAAALDPDPTKRPATGAAFLQAYRQALA